MNDTTTPSFIVGVVLAGGRSQRMGLDKARVLLAGKSLLQHACDRLAMQVNQLVINANSQGTSLKQTNLRIISDTVEGHPGPLAGLLAAMRWAETSSVKATHVVMVPVDTPFFPIDLVQRLVSGMKQASGSQVAFATTADGDQPVFALIDIRLVDELEADLRSGKARRVGEWLRSHPFVAVRFDDAQAFFNLNTPADVTEAERMHERLTQKRSKSS